MVTVCGPLSITPNTSLCLNCSHNNTVVVRHTHYTKQQTQVCSVFVNNHVSAMLDMQLFMNMKVNSTSPSVFVCFLLLLLLLFHLLLVLTVKTIHQQKKTKKLERLKRQWQSQYPGQVKVTWNIFILIHKNSLVKVYICNSHCKANYSINY